MSNFHDVGSVIRSSHLLYKVVKSDPGSSCDSCCFLGSDSCLLDHIAYDVFGHCNSNYRKDGIDVHFVIVGEYD